MKIIRNENDVLEIRNEDGTQMTMPQLKAAVEQAHLRIAELEGSAPAKPEAKPKVEDKQAEPTDENLTGPEVVARHRELIAAGDSAAAGKLIGQWRDRVNTRIGHKSSAATVATLAEQIRNEADPQKRADLFAQWQAESGKEASANERDELFKKFRAATEPTERARLFAKIQNEVWQHQ